MTLDDCATRYAEKILEAVTEAVVKASTDPATGEVLIRSGEATLGLIAAAATIMALPSKHGVTEPSRTIARDVAKSFRKRLDLARLNLVAGLVSGTISYETKVLGRPRPR